jgi:hypothetical protein
MADFDLSGGLLNFSNRMFGGGGGYDDLLTEEQRKRIAGDSLTSMAAALLKAGGPSTQRIGLGQALGSALEAGAGAAERGQMNAVQQILMRQKIDEMKADKTRQANMSALFPQVFQQTTTPEQASIPEAPGFPARDDLGNLMPGAQVTTPASTRLQIDPNKLQALAMMSKNPLESLGQIAKLVPDLRRAGFTGTGAAEVNPFAAFTSDETIPVNIRNVAKQYANSYAAGTLDPDKVDERTKQLGDMAQRAQQYTETKTEQAANRDRMAAQFKQSQDALEQFRTQGLENSAQARALAGSIAQQSLDLKRQAEANKPETFSYSQKKDFDTVQTNIASAKNAEDSATIATRAAPLISEAYGGKIESGIKGLAGAVGISTTAKEANDQLTQLSQQLALKTPKFSGPTSDADAKRYDKAVGDLANPSVTPASKVIALKNITELSRKASDYAKQQENYYFANNKSLRGFVYTESNPFGQ